MKIMFTNIGAKPLAFLFVSIFFTARLFAQDPDPRIDTLNKNHEALDNRVEKLEFRNDQTLDLMRQREERDNFLITILGSLLGLLVTYQIYASVVQQRREGKRDDNAAEKVSNIMEVVHQTLESRLNAEEEERKKRQASEKEMERVLNQVKPLEQFYRSFQVRIQNMRRRLEETAIRLAHISRHDFRINAEALREFAREVLQFKTDLEPLEEEKHEFSARIPYIRGIAAHYSNQPELAKEALLKVTSAKQPEPDEDSTSYDRRIANASYYLGLIESNQGNQDQAIAYFEKANGLDLQYRDFLTRIVTAESYILKNDYGRAIQYITEVQERLLEMEQQDGHLKRYHLRLQSRATLLRANIAMLERKNNWHKEVKEWLEVVHLKDPAYYYSTTTLAQAYAVDDMEKAKRLFHEAYQSILSLRDLETVKEVRSRILLLMTAGLCAKQSLSNGQQIWDDYLDEADILRSNLPRIDEDQCTAYSILGKRNEVSEVLHHHIEMIREGKVLVK
ncbi:MAG: hypothetical protein KDC61_04345 [Saprospiraceae bacterium]|nr:hypothetical protein [Saprospiraceae bacterium]